MTLNFKNLFAAGCCALLAGSASASIVTVEVNGTGVDYRAARADALKEALFRVTVVSVSVDEVSHLSLDTSSTSIPTMSSIAPRVPTGSRTCAFACRYTATTCRA